MTLLPWPYADGAYAKVVMAPTPPTTGTVIMLTPGRGALFPDPTTTGPYVVSIWPDNQVYLGGNITDHGELSLVIGRSGDSLSLTRAVQGSTARIIVAGDQVALTPTAQTHNDHMKWLTGAAGGQIFRGGTGAGEDLTLWSTGHATKGKVRIGGAGVLYWDEAAQQLYIDRNYSGPTGSKSPFWITERGTADPSIEFATYGANIWEIGIDNSDDDAYKVNYTTGVGDFTDVGIRVDRTGAVLIKSPPGAGPDTLQVGQNAVNSYARLRLEGRYHGASGAGIFDIEALDTQVYIFDRTNGAFLLQLAVGGQVTIPGALNTGALGASGLTVSGAANIGGNVGISGTLSTNGVITTNTRIGVGVVPGYGLDVELGASATYAKFGPSLPVYIIAANPNIGLNAYYSGGWVYGKGSTSHYGAVLTLDPVSGTFMIGVSTVPGAANTAAAISYPFLITPSTVRLPGLPSQAVLGTNANGDIVPGSAAAGGAFLAVPASCSAAVMQAAINSLANGGKIEMPPGVYDWGSTNVTIPGGRSYTFVGAGKGATIIKATGTANALFQFAGTAWTQALVKASHVQFVDIQFNADSGSNQDLLYFVTDATYWLQPPAKPLFEALRCYFQYTDHGSNRSANMCHFNYVTGIRFVDCEWGYDLGTLGAGLQYGLGVWLQPGIQDANFTDCSWYFMNGLVCGGGGITCEGIIFQNCRMVGQGLNSDSPLGNHYGIVATQITDFQWRGGEITGVTGFAMHLDSGGPFMIESAYISGNRSTNDIGLIQVENTISPNDLFIHHVFFKNDGNMQYAILLNNTHGNGYFGSIHDCMFEMTHTGANYVGDPGPTVSYILWHHNFHDAARVGSSPGWEGYP